MIDIERHGAVALLRWDRPKVHALDVDLLGALLAALDTVEASDAGALVLTGTGRVFSAGVDLQQVLDGGADYLERFIPLLIAAFARLFSSPLPVVAAVNGAAVAGGCVLACACDRRVAVHSARIGASELLVGVPFPVSALEILRWACGDRTEEVVLTGTLYAGDDAVGVGLAHELTAPDGLVDRALAVADALAAVPSGAFRLAKAQLRRATVDRIAADAPLVDPEVRALWSAPETTEAIRAQVARMAAR
ncbi:MAG: enoyl-CoA hydratase/isomerase family protein [Acidimicrobiales bacterium]